MTRLPYLFVVLAALLFVSCSDDTSSTNNNNNNGGGGGGDKEFRIIMTSPDSVYWGERVTLELRHAKGNRFTVSIEDYATEIDSLWTVNDTVKGLRFVVPVNSTSALLRVYDTSNTLAKGDIVLTVLQRDISNVTGYVLNILPIEAYAGELLMIQGGFPERQRDMTVRINDVTLPIVAFSNNRIIARITDQVVSGAIYVLFRDKVIGNSGFGLLEPKGTFLEESTVRAITVDVAALTGTQTVINNTTKDSTQHPFPAMTRGVGFLGSRTIQRIGDSIILVVEEPESNYVRKLTIRLKLESQNRVSGILRVSGEYQSGHGAWDEIEIKNMHWKRFTDDEWMIYANSFDIDDQLVSLKTVNSQAEELDTRVYSGSTINGQFIIRITP